MRTHAVKWGLLVTVAALCFVGYAGVQGALGVMEGWTKNLPSIEDTDFTNTSRESVMYAGDEATLLAEFQLEKRDPVTYEEISPYVLEGTVDTEDVRFYEHEGVDIPGIARAFVNNLRGGDLEGASTITQQLVRNTVLSEEATDISFERKIREAELAIDLEKRFSKDDILVKYLNIINYGDGCYGIEAAAQNYFQVSALDLTLAQAATLVGIPQSPTYLNPKVYPDACLARRNVVLDRMLSAGDITQQEHDDAQAEELGLNPAPDAPADGIYAYPFFTSYVRSLLFDENNPYGCSYADLFKGGLTIYTSLDPELQDAAQAAVDNQRANMADNLDASIVAIDVATGQVKAMTRGVPYGQGEGESQVNIATGDGGTGRQAGSTFKAFTLAAAIEQGISPQTLVDCTSPLKKGQDGAPEDFENFNGNDYGIQTIQSATAISSNTGYLRLSNSIHYRDGQPPGRDLPHAARVHRNRGRGRRQSVGDGERLRHAGQRRRETRAHGDHKDPRPRRQRHLASGGERHRRTRVGREGRRRHDEGVGNGVHAEQRHGHVGAVEQRAAGCRQDGHRQLVHRPLAGGLYAQPVVRGLDRRPVRRY